MLFAPPVGMPFMAHACKPTPSTAFAWASCSTYLAALVVLDSHLAQAHCELNVAPRRRGYVATRGDMNKTPRMRKPSVSGDWGKWLQTLLIKRLSRRNILGVASNQHILHCGNHAPTRVDLVNLAAANVFDAPRKVHMVVWCKVGVRGSEERGDE